MTTKRIRTPHNNPILAVYCGEPVPAQTLASAIRELNLEGEALGVYSELDAAVATVLLRSVRSELPQWAVVDDDEVTLGRKRHRSKKSGFAPKHLFTLNWADTGPGFSWPMAYFATVVPQHNAVVVTASADSPDAYGFTDFAIGHFPADVDLVAGAHDLIVADWRRLAADGQTRWAYLFDEALVSAEQAESWADEVSWVDAETGVEDSDDVD